MTQNTTKNPNCLKCRHFYVTWDTNFPKGCRLFKFKSKALPSILVKQSTGSACNHFISKPNN